MIKVSLSASFLTLVLCACDSRPVTEGAPTPPTPAAPTTTPTPAAGGQAAGKIDPAEKEILAVTRKWNEALAKRDADALKQVYASKVRFYTVEMTRDAAVKAKSGAFVEAKDYTQSISNIEIDARKKDAPRADFNKSWTANGKPSAVRASLVFTKEEGKWLVREESDIPSDQRRNRAAASAESCEALILQLVSSTSEARAILSGPTDPAHGHPSNGTRIAGGPPDQPNYAIAVHENHDDYLVTLAWYDVDPKTAKVTATLDDKVLTTNPSLADKVKAACSK